MMDSVTLTVLSGRTAICASNFSILSSFAFVDEHKKRRRAGTSHRAELLRRRCMWQVGLQAVGAAGELKLTLGASRSVLEVTSKNSRGLKPSMPAKILVGNCRILVFRSRTTAL